jgi:hypothetical protein
MLPIRSIKALIVRLRAIDFKIKFLDCVIGRRGIAVQLPPSILAKNIILKLKVASYFSQIK